MSYGKSNSTITALCTYYLTVTMCIFFTPARNKKAKRKNLSFIKPYRGQKNVIYYRGLFMPFREVNPEEELKELNALLDSYPELRQKFEAEQKEFEFRLKLARVRKEKNFTQNNIKEATGLTQQAISRIEKGTNERSPTLKTLIRYVDALGYELTLTQK